MGGKTVSLDYNVKNPVKYDEYLIQVQKGSFGRPNALRFPLMHKPWRADRHALTAVHNATIPLTLLGPHLAIMSYQGRSYWHVWYGYTFSCTAICLRLFEFMLRCSLISFLIIQCCKTKWTAPNEIQELHPAFLSLW